MYTENNRLSALPTPPPEEEEQQGEQQQQPREQQVAANDNDGVFRRRSMTFKLQSLIIDCIPTECKNWLNPAQLRILRELIFYPISNRRIRLHHQPNYTHLQTWGKTRTFLFACFYDLFYLQARMLNPLCGGYSLMRSSKKYLIIVSNKRAVRHWHNEWVALNDHVRTNGSIETNASARSFFLPCYSSADVREWNWVNSPGIIVPIDVFNKSAYLKSTISWTCVIVDTFVASVLEDINTLWTFYIHNSIGPLTGCINYDTSNTLSMWIHPKCFIHNVLFELCTPIQKFVAHNKILSTTYVKHFIETNRDHLIRTRLLDDYRGGVGSDQQNWKQSEEAPLNILQRPEVECLLCCETTSDTIDTKCCPIENKMCRSCLFRYLFSTLYNKVNLRHDCATPLKCAFCTKKAQIVVPKQQPPQQLQDMIMTKRQLHSTRVLTQLVLLKHIQQSLETSNGSANFLLLIDKTFFSKIISRDSLFTTLKETYGTLEILANNFHNDKNSCSNPVTFSIFCFSKSQEILSHFEDVKLPNIDTIFFIKQERDGCQITDHFLSSITCTNIQSCANLYIHRILF